MVSRDAPPGRATTRAALVARARLPGMAGEVSVTSRTCGFTGAVGTLAGWTASAAYAVKAASAPRPWPALTVGLGTVPTTSRLTTLAAGINVRRYQIGSYMIAAWCFSVAGMVYAGFIGNASNSAGDDYLLPGIAAVVVGGTPLNGGRGSVVASGIAALFITQLGQLVLALGATASTQLLLQALAIVVATTIRYLPALRWKWRSRTGAN